MKALLRRVFFANQEVTMKARRIVLTATALIFFAICMTATPAMAASLSWDPNQTQGPSGGSNTWNTSSLYWWNGAADAAWTDASADGTDTAVFGGSAGTVTLNSNLSALGLQFAATGYTVQGSGTLTLGSGGINASSLTTGTTTLGAGLSLQGGQSWQLGNGATLSVNGTVARNVGAAVELFRRGDV